MLQGHGPETYVTATFSLTWYRPHLMLWRVYFNFHAQFNIRYFGQKRPPLGGGINKEIFKNREEIRLFYCLAVKGGGRGNKYRNLAKIFTLGSIIWWHRAVVGSPDEGSNLLNGSSKEMQNVSTFPTFKFYWSIAFIYLKPLLKTPSLTVIIRFSTHLISPLLK